MQFWIPESYIHAYISVEKTCYHHLVNLSIINCPVFLPVVWLPLPVPLIIHGISERFHLREQQAEMYLKQKGRRIRSVVSNEEKVTIVILSLSNIALSEQG